MRLIVCNNRLTNYLFLQARYLGNGDDDKTGMVLPKSSHEVQILHNNKTFGLTLLEVDSKTELPCNQVIGPRSKKLNKINI